MIYAFKANNKPVLFFDFITSVKLIKTTVLLFQQDQLSSVKTLFLVQHLHDDQLLVTLLYQKLNRFEKFSPVFGAR